MYYDTIPNMQSHIKKFLIIQELIKKFYDHIGIFIIKLRRDIDLISINILAP